MRQISALRLGVVGVFIVAGAALFLLSDIRAELNAPVPVIIPFPPAGRSIARPFSVGLGGRFEAQVITAAAPRARIDSSRAGQLVRCDAAATVTGGDVRIIEQLDGLEAFDWSPHTTSWATARAIRLPHRGDYLLTITNRGSSDSIFDRGAFVQLARLEANGVDFAPFVLACLAYVFLLIAFLVLVTTGRTAGAGN